MHRRKNVLTRVIVFSSLLLFFGCGAGAQQLSEGVYSNPIFEGTTGTTDEEAPQFSEGVYFNPNMDFGSLQKVAVLPFQNLTDYRSITNLSPEDKNIINNTKVVLIEELKDTDFVFTHVKPQPPGKKTGKSLSG